MKNLTETSDFDTDLVAKIKNAMKEFKE